MTEAPPARRRTRTRRFRIARALLLGVAALGLLYTWDGSRQPASGSGWQLLVAQRGLGKPLSLTVLGDQTAFEAAWERLRIIPAPPAIDFTRELVVWFVDSGTFACRSRLDGVDFDLAARAVTVRFARGLVLNCDDEADVPDSFLVKLDRDRLPVGTFRLVMDGRARPGAPEPMAEIDSTRLSPAG